MQIRKQPECPHSIHMKVFLSKAILLLVVSFEKYKQILAIIELDEFLTETLRPHNVLFFNVCQSGVLHCVVHESWVTFAADVTFVNK